MKKTLVLSALAAAATAATAQSSVTIYGILDAGVTQVSGLRGGTQRQVVSGMMDGSRLGFRINEDLGGGWRVLGTIEHRLEVDDGTASNRPASGSQVPDRIASANLMGLPSAFQPIVNNVSGSLGNTFGVNLRNGFWDRQSFIGLITPVGAFLLGRQYTPAYEVSAMQDTLGTQSALALGQVASTPPSIDIRADNAVAYRIQLGGLQASAMVAEASATSGRLYGLMAQYKVDAWQAGIGYNTRKNEQGDKSLTSFIVGGQVNLGPGRLGAVYATIKDDNPTGLSAINGTLSVTPGVGPAIAGVVTDAYRRALRQDGRLWQIGYRLDMGPHTVYVAYNQFDDKRAANADTSSYGVTYSYALSKRTDLNGMLVRFVNDDLGQAAPGATGYLGGVTASAGTDSTAIGVGIRHRF